MPPDCIHILHLCSNSVARMGILRSQVVEPMRRLARDPALAITIVSGERVGERSPADERDLHDVLKASGIGLTIFEKRVGPALRTRRPNPLRRALAPWHLWRDTRAMSSLVESFAREHQPCVVQARSYIPAWAALRAKERGLCRLVFDPRGILPEELAYAQGWSEKSRRYRWWKDLEKRIVTSSDAIIALSEPMACHYRHVHECDPLVIPCCVDLDRFRPGKRVPYGAAPLRLVYLVGVDVPYQTIEQALEIRAAMSALWPGGATLRICSPDAAAVGARLRCEDVTVDAPPRDEIPRILADSDIGLLVRVPSVISRVASPVKFPECLAAGLPVVATSDIGECDRILAEHGCGVSLPASDPGAWKQALRSLSRHLQSDAPAMRAAARRAAEIEFGWDRHMPLLRKAIGVEK